MFASIHLLRLNLSTPEDNPTALELSFEGGTLVISGLELGQYDGPAMRFDDRVQRYRAPAHEYRRVLAHLLRSGFDVDDQARQYEPLALTLSNAPDPYEHQAQALEAWVESGKRGVVILPTGAGKTYVAQLAMMSVQRSALVVVPTIDLLNQWASNLERAFGQKIGMIGGGSFEIEPITVSTYDSACIHMERLGGRFGLLIFDEVHHLPSEMYQHAAHDAIAPFRMGLTATYERADGKEATLDALIGPVVYRRSIKELSGDILADYDVISVEVEMEEEDMLAYQSAREVYRSFVRINRISMGSPQGWQRFLSESSRSKDGRQALQSFFAQKQLSLVHRAKLAKLYELLVKHHEDRVIIFTNDNASVYAISRQVLCPSITHQTPAKERKEILERFNQGSYRTVATSKVLNEGVDVPEASVAIILSGSGSVREHVQRLGRILRRSEGKRATLYELITSNSGETYVSQRRREHDAYQ